MARPPGLDSDFESIPEEEMNETFPDLADALAAQKNRATVDEQYIQHPTPLTPYRQHAADNGVNFVPEWPTPQLIDDIVKILESVTPITKEKRRILWANLSGLPDTISGYRRAKNEDWPKPHEQKKAAEKFAILINQLLDQLIPADKSRVLDVDDLTLVWPLICKLGAEFVPSARKGWIVDKEDQRFRDLAHDPNGYPQRVLRQLFEVENAVKAIISDHDQREHKLKAQGRINEDGKPKRRRDEAVFHAHYMIATTYWNVTEKVPLVSKIRSKATRPFMEFCEIILSELGLRPHSTEAFHKNFVRMVEAFEDEIPWPMDNRERN